MGSTPLPPFTLLGAIVSGCILRHKLPGGPERQFHSIGNPLVHSGQQLLCWCWCRHKGGCRLLRYGRHLCLLGYSDPFQTGLRKSRVFVKRQRNAHFPKGAGATSRQQGVLGVRKRPEIVRKWAGEGFDTDTGITTVINLSTEPALEFLFVQWRLGSGPPGAQPVLTIPLVFCSYCGSPTALCCLVPTISPQAQLHSHAGQVSKGYATHVWI